MILRSLILFAPYRSIISYSEELKTQYEKEYDKWQRAYKQSLYELQYRGINNDEVSTEAMDSFKEYMNQDFNVQNVLTLINTLVKDINTSLRAKDYEKLSLAMNSFKKILDILGINLFINPMNDIELDVYRKWNDARINKDFDSADTYRKQLVDWNIL